LLVEKQAGDIIPRRRRAVWFYIIRATGASVQPEPGDSNVSP
jgi:hypothetical protein